MLGHNGSGKSTLAKHFNGILLPTSGKVLVDGIDTTDESRIYDIRQTVGMVFQNPDNQIVATIVEEDVAFGPQNFGVSKEEAEFAAGFSLGNIGKAEAIVSSEEFQDLKELTLSILRYIHEIESYEIADKVKEYKKYKNRIEDFFDIFLMWFRDIMLLKADNSVNAEAAKKKIIFKNEYAYLKKQVDKLDLEAIDYVIGKIHRARVRIKSNVNFDATLELLIVEARREF